MMIRSVPQSALAQPILPSLEECDAMNQAALAAHDSALQVDPPNYGRLVMSFVQYGMVHSSLAHLPLPQGAGVETLGVQSGLLHNRATVLRDMGSYRQAAQAFEEVVAIQKEMGDPRRIDTLVSVINLHCMTGAILPALHAAQESVALSANMEMQCKSLPAGDPNAEAMVQLAQKKLLIALNQVHAVGQMHAAQVETVDRAEAADIRLGVSVMFDHYLGASHEWSLAVRADAKLANAMMFKNAPDNASDSPVGPVAEATALASLDGSTRGAVAGRLAAENQK